MSRTHHETHAEDEAVTHEEAPPAAPAEKPKSLEDRVAALEARLEGLNARVGALLGEA